MLRRNGAGQETMESVQYQCHMVLLRFAHKSCVVHTLELYYSLCVCWHTGFNTTTYMIFGLVGFVALCVIITATLLICKWKKRSASEAHSL